MKKYSTPSVSELGDSAELVLGTKDDQLEDFIGQLPAELRPSSSVVDNDN